MEAGGADASDDASPMSQQPTDPVPVSPPSPSVDPLLSQGDVTSAVDRTVEAARRILSEVHRWRQRRRDAGQDVVGLHDAYRNGSFGAVPASSEAIASLREMTVVDQTREDECAVCLKSYEEGDKMKMMPCFHGFHEDCILTWLGISRLCPLCRYALQLEARTH
ncbi:unnamed protein product [Urochloa decumbens]|uniref:RING-type domain-containing protein n=1 Tax=Urochloa decumbens TaxID=240449 RepID=A0ABC8W878_9POAL